MKTNRKKQIEKDLLPRLLKNLEKAGCKINDLGIGFIKDELRVAAMVGAAEQRQRAIAIIPASLLPSLCDEGVLEMLGYKGDL